MTYSHRVPNNNRLAFPLYWLRPIKSTHQKRTPPSNSREKTHHLFAFSSPRAYIISCCTRWRWETEAERPCEIAVGREQCSGREIGCRKMNYLNVYRHQFTTALSLPSYSVFFKSFPLVSHCFEFLLYQRASYIHYIRSADGSNSNSCSAMID